MSGRHLGHAELVWKWMGEEIHGNPEKLSLLGSSYSDRSSMPLGLSFLTCEERLVP